MIALLAASALAAAEPATEPSPTRVLLGVEAFGEYFPVSSRLVPTLGFPNHPVPHQQSVLTGGRLTVGYQHSDTFRGFVVAEAGYAAAGATAGNGQDGVMLGVGGEGDWLVSPLLLPFVRLTGDFKVQQRSMLPTGTLADRAVVLALGARVLRVLDLHLALGSDFAGGFAVGFGAGLGWQWTVW